MYPKYVMIKQTQPADKITDVVAAVRKTVAECKVDLNELSGKVVGITAGSRGIANVPEVIRTVVSIVKEHNGTPVVFAAMGSHGGGTAEGQREVLASLGVTEEFCGCEIRTCGECISLGKNDLGEEVFVNKLVQEFDKIILVNRIKQHTDFDDYTESGLLKIMSIGIGNPAGAAAVHASGLRMSMGETIRSTAKLQLEKLPVFMGVAVAENWKHETDTIEAIAPCDMFTREAEILKGVKERTLRLPADKFDVLIVQESGKDISGTNLDTKVVGRIGIPSQKDPETPKITIIGVLDIREASHGNAIGIGITDLITRKFYDKIDIEATALNGLTSNCLAQSKIPCVAANDEDLVKNAYINTGIADAASIKSMVIKNTGALEYLAVSLPLYEELKGDPKIECLSEPFDLTYDADGNLLLEIAGH